MKKVRSMPHTLILIKHRNRGGLLLRTASTRLSDCADVRNHWTTLENRLVTPRGQLRRHRHLVPIRRLIDPTRVAHPISREDLGIIVHPSLDASTNSLHPGSATTHLRLKVPLILAQLTGGIVVPTLVPDPTTTNLVKLVPQLSQMRIPTCRSSSRCSLACFAT